jgi:hypothetical protein
MGSVVATNIALKRTFNFLAIATAWRSFQVIISINRLTQQMPLDHRLAVVTIKKLYRPQKTKTVRRRPVYFAGGPGGNWASSPAFALACAKALAGCRMRLETPTRPAWTRVQFPQIRTTKQNGPPLRAGRFVLMVDPAGIEPHPAYPYATCCPDEPLVRPIRFCTRQRISIFGTMRDSSRLVMLIDVNFKHDTAHASTGYLLAASRSTRCLFRWQA